MYQQLKCPYSYFSEALEFYLTVLFPCQYPQSYPRNEVSGGEDYQKKFGINSKNICNVDTDFQCRLHQSRQLILLIYKHNESFDNNIAQARCKLRISLYIQGEPPCAGQHQYVFFMSNQFISNLPSDSNWLGNFQGSTLFHEATAKLQIKEKQSFPLIINTKT